MKLPHILEIEVSQPEHRDYGVCGYEVASLAHQIHHDHHCVEAMQIREFHNEVDAHYIPSLLRDCKGVQLTKWFLFLGLGAKTHVTCLAVLANIPGHVWSPVTVHDQFEHFPAPCMSPNL